MEQGEEPGENYSGIEIDVQTAGREILSGGVPELWTGVLVFLCQAVLSRIPRC
jgi:hypothetical protein